jgi:hypothetical protein
MNLRETVQHGEVTYMTSSERSSIATSLTPFVNCLTITNMVRQKKEAKQKDIRALPIRTREKFAAFIEHIGLVTKSGLISRRLANYEFGYYAILCWECSPFWEDIVDPEAKQNDPYWAL